MPSESEDDPILALKQGHFNIHCPTIELAQKTPNQARIYFGSGYIKQNLNGLIEFTIYANNISSHNPFGSSLISSLTQQSGTLFGEDEFYTLTATSYRGVVWEADNIFDFSFHWSATTPRLYGIINTLRRQRKRLTNDKLHRVIMHFFDIIDIPCSDVMETNSNNFDGAIFVATENKNFRIQRLDDDIVVQIRRSR
jgi:hypothetical protein